MLRKHKKERKKQLKLRAKRDKGEEEKMPDPKYKLADGEEDTETGMFPTIEPIMRQESMPMKKFNKNIEYYKNVKERFIEK